MPDAYRIKVVHDMPDLLATVPLQRAVWRMSGDECTSPHLMKAAIVNGGSVIGAEANGQLIGFCFGIVARRGGEVWLWSHMAAVHPDYQGSGIGVALKRAQREWALDNGFRVMAWTFDPMQSGNANFNFNRLGVTARHYYVDHYGAMADGINAGLASDRLEARWRLDDPHVSAMAEDGDPPRYTIDEAEKLVAVDEAGEPRRAEPAMDAGTLYAVEIPLSVAALKAADLERAKTWQLMIRAAITASFEAGCHVCGFAREDDRAWYLLRR